MEVKTTGAVPESKALEEARSYLGELTGILAEVELDFAARRDKDALEARPARSLDGTREVSSVRPRDRKGEGVAAHELRASPELKGGERSKDEPAVRDTGLNSLEAFLSGPVAPRDRGSFHARKALDYYADNMEEHHRDLATLDFHRSEEHWYERYRLDHARRIEEGEAVDAKERDLDAKEITRDYAGYDRYVYEDTQRRYADELASASREADKHAESLAVERRVAEERHYDSVRSNGASDWRTRHDDDYHRRRS